MTLVIPWIRVSNAIQDPITGSSVAQDQVVKVVGDDGDWYKIETLEGVSGRVPKILALPVSDPIRSAGQYLYCSTSAYTSIKQEELPFSAFSLFVASPSKAQDGWLEGFSVTDSGGKLGNVGMLPEGYLVHLKLASDTAAPIQQSMKTSFTTNFEQIGESNSAREPVSSRSYNVAPYARANFEFRGEFDNELSFVADEMITLIRKVDNEWLEGSIGGRTGIFPASFVQIIVDLPDSGAVASSGAEKKKNASDEGIGFATVKHPFTGRHTDELSVQAGDTVRVVKMVNEEWVMCRDPDSDATGIVPVGFLDVYLDDEDDEVPKNGRKTSESFNRNSYVGQSSTQSDWRNTRVDSSDWGTSAFGGNTSTSSSSNAQWATFGEDWIAPAPKTSAPARPPPPKQSSLSSPNDVVSVTEMFGMVDRQAPPRPNAPASMFQASNELELAGIDGDSTQDEKKNKVLEELINSELQFITDINAYTDAIDGSSYLSTKQKVLMRNGCAQILQLSGTLVQLLTNEQLKVPNSQAVGYCFLQLRKSFAQTYGYYFRNIEHINQLLNSAKTGGSMEEALNEVVQRMRESGASVIDGATALGRPVQRCLKYPLFLNEFIKYTPVTHVDHPKLMEALKQMSNLGQKMNESKRRKELTRKYAEEEVPQSLGDRLSKLTIHSLKKKSNRFTYRMGSSLGVVKVTKDVDFDRLVCELDSAERRLVRFNYMLVIYRKKMFYETRVILHKRLVEPRKKLVANSEAEHQLYAFNNAVKEFSDLLNVRVRDEIVKALRSIPKRLIKKRNDKLMDYEAAKTKEKERTNQIQRLNAIEKQKDFEALNNQVKQQLPKSIDNLNQVLQNAMKTVTTEDEALMQRLKQLFEEQKAISAADSNAYHRRVILANTPCFVSCYDTDRLKPLTKIANKGAQISRMRARSASPIKDRKRLSSSDKKSDSIQSANQWAEENPVIPQSFSSNTASSSTNATSTSSHLPDFTHMGSKFRPQTAEERKTILEKAKLKNRMGDMYVATSHYPTDPGMMKMALSEGKLLLVRQNDLVLAVNKEVPSTWLCYNGYYNAMLPSAVLKLYKPPVNDPLGIENGAPSGKWVSIANRPHSTPPKSQNLLDLEDIFGSSSNQSISVQPIQPLSSVPLAASPAPSFNAPAPPLAPTSSAAAPLSPPAFHHQQTLPPKPTSFTANFPSLQQKSTLPTPPSQPNYLLDDSPSLFENVPKIDWGVSTKTPSLPNLAKVETPSIIDWTTPSTETAPGPPLPASSAADPWSSTPSFDPFSVTTTTTSTNPFPVSFDAEPSEKAPQTMAGLPPLPESSKTQQRPSPNASIKSGSALWGTSPVQRGESPQPLIPSRPAPSVKTTWEHYTVGPYDVPPAVSEPAQPSPAAKFPVQFQPAAYDTVPTDTTSQLYSVPPMYDTTPGAQYDVPPSERSGLYDQPPAESVTSPRNGSNFLRPTLGDVRVEYDFVPQGSNQMGVKEGEKLGVIQKHDDDGNPEWLLIQRPDGQVGYVPAAYCRFIL